MEDITSLNELGSFLQEFPDLKVEGDHFAFPRRNKRIEKKKVFLINIDGQEVELTVEQIVHCFRT